jgi:dihydrofolate reductase
MAIQMAEEENPKEIHIGGGATLYKEALPFVSRLYVTWVHDEPLADTFFPPFEDEFKVISESGDKEYEGLHYEWVDYERK